MKRIKLLPSILMLVLCVAILAIGVYAASPITGNLTGTISITAAQGVKIAVYRGTSATAENLIDSAFGSSEVELAAGGATLDASSATSPSSVTPYYYTVVLSTNQETNYVVDTETIESVDGYEAESGERVEGAVVITKLHKPYTANDVVTVDSNGNACFTTGKPYTIQIAVQCGAILNKVINVSYDIVMKIYESTEYAGSGINGVDYLYFGEYPQAEASVTAANLTYYDDFYGYNDDSTSAERKIARQTYTDGTNRYVLFDEKYYQIQPLKWRILNQETDGTTMLLCDTIVEQVCFQQFYNGTYASGYYATDKDGGILQENGMNAYANNYNVSTLRTYLIDTFYNGAFCPSEQVIIKAGTVDNSADLVFAPSVAEVTNSTYGFEASESNSDTRKITASAYASATGVRSSSGSGFWWLCSPFAHASCNARNVISGGSVGSDSVNSTYNGAVPALLLGL